VKTLELIDEFSLNQTTHLTLSAFMIRMKDILEQKIVDNHGAPILQFQNYDKVKTNGFEAEINHQWHSGAKIRSSVSYQSSHE
ncbi:TonB-dependent receptor, partial [Acinetobacter baumannii]